MFAEPPKKLSTDRASLHYDICYRRVGVKLDGKEMPGNVNEYDVDEGWVDVRVRRADGRYRLDQFGKYVLERKHGVVQPYFKAEKISPMQVLNPVVVQHDDDAAKRQAVDKQARKAAKRAALVEREKLR